MLRPMLQARALLAVRCFCPRSQGFGRTTGMQEMQPGQPHMFPMRETGSRQGRTGDRGPGDMCCLCTLFQPAGAVRTMRTPFHAVVPGALAWYRGARMRFMPEQGKPQNLFRMRKVPEGCGKGCLWQAPMQSVLAIAIAHSSMPVVWHACTRCWRLPVSFMCKQRTS